MHDCAAGRACRDPRVDTETQRREPALIEEAYALCRPCERAVRQAIRELPSDYTALSEITRHKPVRGQSSVHMTRNPSMPLNGSALALMDELAEWAEAGMALLAPKLNIEAKRRQKLRGYPLSNWPVIEQAQRVMPHNLELLLDVPETPVRMWIDNGTRSAAVCLSGVQVALKLQRAHAKVKGVAGLSDPRRRLSMPCPVIECGMPTLGIDNGQTDVRCTSCGGCWTEAEYDWLAGMLVGSTSEKEINMLRWLLAEKAWQLTQLEHKLSRVEQAVTLNPDELRGFDAATLAVLVREILDGA